MKTLYKMLAVIIALAVITVMLIALYKNIEPSITDNNIKIEAVLEQNNTSVKRYDEYLLTVNMDINKDSKIMIYPYIEGLGNISFSDEEETGYYLPSSVGTDFTEEVAIKGLKRSGTIEKDDISLIGFYLPEKAGHYKARIYLNKFDNFKEIRNPVVICVYTEKKFGKELTRTNIVPVIIK